MEEFEEKKDNIENTSRFLDIFERVNHFVEKHGLKNIVLTVMVAAVLGLVSYAFLNPTAVVNAIDKVRAEKASEQMRERIAADPAIRANLITLRETLDADRAFVFEMHNGNANLTGLHFIYVDMTYDEPEDGLDKICDSYLNMRTSMFPWVGEIYNRHYWFGSIEKMREIDPEIYYRLKKEGIENLAMIMIDDEQTDSSCGILGIAYYRDIDIPETDDIRRMLNKYSIILSPQLISKQYKTK